MRLGTKTQGAAGPSLRLRTPAKVTLVLRVLGPRKDGYHDVQIALAAVSLYDTIEIQRIPDKGLSLEVDSAESLGPEPDNLVWRAAREFEAAAGIELGVALRLTKRIPSGAGLGGGSGNAAATLIACNRLWGEPLGVERLAAAAARLGSDVPFFLAARPAWAEGRGERLRALPDFPRLVLLAVKPAFSIPTGPAYRALAASRQGRSPVPHGDPPPLNTVDEVVAALHNDFEPTLCSRYPELTEIKARLVAEGALGALLSGTGSALFGVFAAEAARNRAAERLAREDRWAVMPCETLAGHRYESES
jgi:4-diphosphocytidyl-2-C-methyl-D-erythritol kinase